MCELAQSTPTRTKRGAPEKELILGIETFYEQIAPIAFNMGVTVSVCSLAGAA